MSTNIALNIRPFVCVVSHEPARSRDKWNGNVLHVHLSHSSGNVSMPTAIAAVCSCNTSQLTPVYSKSRPQHLGQPSILRLSSCGLVEIAPQIGWLVYLRHTGCLPHWYHHVSRSASNCHYQLDVSPSRAVITCVPMYKLDVLISTK